ncbi:hypothetical protein [Bradyrhizobium sp. LA7.1]|uniref:hypothetical protein n=1 Tax=Bradyrhizobium sp. LA7.1 TaxID=3156324 RepID=UPI003398C306
MVFAVTLGLAGVVHAEPLAKEEGDFVAQEISAATVYAKCSGFEMVPNAGEAIGDRMGVGANVRSAAMAAYAQTIPGLQFNRAYLIPEVTRRANDVMRLLRQKEDDGTLCGLAPAYAKLGWIRAK